MFRITNGKGFHIQFPNGLVLSTQFGMHSYCDNNVDNKLMRDAGVKDILKYMEDYDKDIKKLELKCKDAEIAVFRSDGKGWLTREMIKELFPEEREDDVMGYVDIEKWMKIYEWCKNYKVKGRRNK